MNLVSLFLLLSFSSSLFSFFLEKQTKSDSPFVSSFHDQSPGPAPSRRFSSSVEETRRNGRAAKLEGISWWQEVGKQVLKFCHLYCNLGFFSSFSNRSSSLFLSLSLSLSLSFSLSLNCFCLSLPSKITSKRDLLHHFTQK